MIRRSVYVRHLIVVGLLMTGMLLLTGRGRVTRDTPGTAAGTVARWTCPGAKAGAGCHYAVSPFA